jgi:secreted Zn-dependent insulinase-like peptidase
MAVGNLTADQAREQASLIRGALTPRLSRDDIPTLQPLRVANDATTLQPHSTREESLVLRYLQGRDQSLEEQARLSVLAQWLDTPFYQQLRTEEQLGYIVNAGYSPLLEAPGVALIVQSPDVDSATIAERMDDFLHQAQARLEALSDEELAAHRQAVHDRLRQRDTSLQGMANRYWQATALEEIRFDRRERLAELALDVTPEALQTLWPELLGHRLDIRFDPGDAPSDITAYRNARASFNER